MSMCVGLFIIVNFIGCVLFWNESIGLALCNDVGTPLTGIGTPLTDISTPLAPQQCAVSLIFGHVNIDVLQMAIFVAYMNIRFIYMYI